MLLILSLSAAAAVSGLQVSQEPMQLLGSRLGAGVVRAASSASAALDPQMFNVLGEDFHVDVEGVHTLIKMPKDADIESPSAVDFGVNATLEDVGKKDCDDLLIRQVDVFGTKLGGSVTSLTFFIASDDFNITDVLGLQVNGVNKTVTEFLAEMPVCKIDRPRTVNLPTKNSFRKRSKMYRAICDIGDVPNTVTVIWSSVWRKAYSDVYYQNDLEVYISGVGSDPGGLLGPDDHSWVQQVHSPCVAGMYR